MKTAKIVKGETIGEGVTKSKKLFLRKGDVEAQAVWKRPTSLGAELYDKWQCEIAAYRLDKLLGLNNGSSHSRKAIQAKLRLTPALGFDSLERGEKSKGKHTHSRRPDRPQ